MTAFPWPDRVVAVTGAGSGIGRAIAQALDARGARLALADWDAAGLAATHDSLRHPALTMTVDVTDPAAMAGFAEAAAARYGVVHQIHNIAGVAGAGGSLRTQTLEQLRRVIEVNLWGVIHGTLAFLPQVSASGVGHVVNVSSLNGVMAQPGLAGYAASKFAVRGFTETLRMELLQERAPVKVTVVLPGGVRTAIDKPRTAEHAVDESAGVLSHRAQVYQERLFRMSADEAARLIVGGVERGRPRVLLGQTRWVDPMVRALPSLHHHIVARWARRTFGDEEVPASRTERVRP